jgi:hypothetical protein
MLSVSVVRENFTFTNIFINRQYVYFVSVETNVIVVNIGLVQPAVRCNTHMTTGRARIVEMGILKMSDMY